jgi:dihydroxyacid dehydratase/phosphogluconate dehydratase
MPYSDAHVLMQDGGPIALVQDGDMISVDAEVHTVDMHVSEAELPTFLEGNPR